MRKVRFCKTNYSNIIFLTDRKVYDVIKYIKSDKGILADSIILNNDMGIDSEYTMCNAIGELLFEDVTSEYRTKKINEILS